MGAPGISNQTAPKSQINEGTKGPGSEGTKGPGSN